MASGEEEIFSEPRTQYTLRIRSGGTELGEHQVILDRGRKRQREITGALLMPETGVIRLDYQPEIEILTLETEVEYFFAAEPPATEGGS